MSTTRAVKSAHMPEGRQLIAVPPALADLADRQCGVLTRQQLALRGIALTQVESMVAARRWQTLGRNVVILHNGPLTAEQRLWCAVLLPSKPTALAGLSAAAAAGLSGFPTDEVHIVVRHDTHTGFPCG